MNRIFWLLISTVISLDASQDAPQPAVVSKKSVLEATTSGSEERALTG
jgi:hypothetical protein